MIFEKGGQRFFSPFEKGVKELFQVWKKGGGGAKAFLGAKNPENLAWVPLEFCLLH